MSKGASNLNRMSDVMLALGEAEKAHVLPTRIQLQKFIYLSDVLGQIVGELKPREGHKTYRNGPYDSAIQNAVDALSFRGLARIAGIWRTPSGHKATSYALAEPGRQFLKLVREHPAMTRTVRIVELVGQEMCSLGWDRIVELVYAEPTYVTTRPSGWGVQLNAEDGLTVSAAFLVAIMRRAASTLSDGREASPEWLTDRFFAFLNDYDRGNGANWEAKS
jgi:hypothetical protein